MISILHCYSDGLLSHIIRFFCKSKYSHSAVLLYIDNQPMIFDSQRNGVQLMNYKNWMTRYKYKYDVSTIDLTDHRLKSIRKYCLCCLGKTKYDFYSLLILQPIYIITGKWLGKKGKSATNRMYCSEFAAEALGIKKSWKMSPDTLSKYLNQQLNQL